MMFSSSQGTGASALTLGPQRSLSLKATRSLVLALQFMILRQFPSCLSWQSAPRTSCLRRGIWTRRPNDSYCSTRLAWQKIHGVILPVTSSTTTFRLASSAESSTSTSLASTSSASGDIMGIPTMEQLQTDSFMKQVQHAQFLTMLLEEDAGRQTDVLMRRLRAQLSHSNGQRGFMVTFLTTMLPDEASSQQQAQVDEKSSNLSKVSNETTTNDIPAALVTVLAELIVKDVTAVESSDSPLVDLLYMNVIMPTAMVTMHTDAQLTLQSTLTAHKATRLIQALLLMLLDSKNDVHNQLLSSDDVAQRFQVALLEPCRSILAAATMTSASKDAKNSNSGGNTIMLNETEGTTTVEGTSATTATVDMAESESSVSHVRYWRSFFERYGYQTRQRDDIAKAMRFLLDLQL